MAENFFSDHFNSNAVPGVTTLTGSLTYDSQRRANAGLGHARKRVAVARMTVGTGAVIGSELRMLQMKSGDRLGAIYVYSSGGATAADADLGIYLSGLSHDGAVVDADLFGSALAVDTLASFDTVEEADSFKEAATLVDTDRWKPLWALAAIGAGTDTVDPMVNYDIVFTVTTAFTVALTELVVVVEYTSGD